MANLEQLEILRQGVDAWNEWREKNPTVWPGLIDADLNATNLKHANLRGADLRGSNLSRANLRSASLSGADLRSSNLSGANLSSANLRGANLGGANLGGANVSGANLSSTSLNGASFQDSRLGFLVLGDTDLSETKGLQQVKQWAPSTIGIDTLYKSQGNIPDEFLRGAGVPEDVITHLLPLIRAGNPIQFYSCFISYSGKDEEFARRLHQRMRAAGLRVWFAPEDLKGGDKLMDQLERAIQLHDRLLLVLSDHSIMSEWVMTEIRRAREAERKEGRRKLFPIRLTDYKTLEEWKCPDSKSGQDLAEEVRQYFIPDFSNWKNHDDFEKAFANLLRDLKAEDTSNSGWANH